MTAALDQTYNITRKQASDDARIRIAGFAILDTLDGLGVSPSGIVSTSASSFGTPDTLDGHEIAGVFSDYPVNYFIITHYIPRFALSMMPIIAIAAGIGFFLARKRILKVKDKDR